MKSGSTNPGDLLQVRTERNGWAYATTLKENSWTVPERSRKVLKRVWCLFISSQRQGHGFGRTMQGFVVLQRCVFWQLAMVSALKALKHKQGVLEQGQSGTICAHTLH